MLIDFVLKKMKSIIRKCFKECKYIEKVETVIKYITDDLEVSSDDFKLNRVNYHKKLSLKVSLDFG